MRHVNAIKFLVWIALTLTIILVWFYLSAPSGDSLRQADNEQGNTSAPHSSSEVTDITKESITFDKLSPEAVKTILGMFTVPENASTETSTQSPKTLPSDIVRLATQPALGAVTGTFEGGFAVSKDAVALGEQTTGTYVKNIVAGDGLQGDANGEGSVSMLAVGAGDGIAVDGDSVSVYLQPGGGMDFVSGALGLVVVCADSEVLKWNGTLSQWQCGTDNTGIGGSITVKESDGTPSVATVSAIEFGPASGSSDEFIVTDQGAGTARIRTGSAIPLSNATATISGAWTFSADIVAGGGLSCTSCVALGSETSGDYVAGLSTGSGLSVSGSGGEGSTPTVSLDSSLAIFKTIDASVGTDPVADSLTDTLSLTSGNGVNVTGDATTDNISFGLNLASGSGLMFNGSALSLLNSCGDGQVLAWSTGSTSWVCSTIAGAANQFSTIGADSGSATADATTDTVTFVGGNGLTTSASDSPDTITLNIDLASGSGLAFSGGALSLMSCSDGQILKVVAGAWACASDNTSLAKAMQQHFSGTNDTNFTATNTALLKNAGGTATALPITIASGNYVEFIATIEASSSLAAGPVTYSVIRDDNLDNDCVASVGDGTRVGGWVDHYLNTPGQGITTSFTFIDTAPGTTSPQYQLCASTTIATGVIRATDRTLVLREWSP